MSKYRIKSTVQISKSPPRKIVYVSKQKTYKLQNKDLAPLIICKEVNLNSIVYQLLYIKTRYGGNIEIMNVHRHNITPIYSLKYLSKD